jgi:hypothetical protein
VTELQINQLIHEKVMGKCWHNADKRVGDSIIIPLQWFCTKCGDEVGHEGVYMSPLHPSYTSSWADYGPMLEECMKKEWWNDFAYYSNGDFKISTMLNPLKGSTAMAEFVKARGI